MFDEERMTDEQVEAELESEMDQDIDDFMKELDAAFAEDEND